MKKQISVALCTTILTISLANPVLANDVTVESTNAYKSIDASILSNIQLQNVDIISDKTQSLEYGDIVIDLDKQGDIEVRMFLNKNSIVIQNGSNLSNNIQPTGKIKITLQAFKKLIIEKWDKIPILKKYRISQSGFLKALDFYFDFADDVNSALDSAIRDTKPDLPNWAVVAIREAILLAIPIL